MSNLYLDFELQIERAATEGQYNVSVLASPAGETQQPYQITFPFAARDLERLQDKLENALLRSRTRSRRALTPEEQVVRQFGQTLFEAVFQGDVRALFYESRLKADHVEKGIRLKLRLQPPEFARLPWEFLLEPRKDEYICLSRDTPIVRYLELAQPVTPLMVTPPLRILGMVVNPTNLPDLDVAAEKQRVERALAQQRGGAIELVWLNGDMVTDLQRALRHAEREPFHIFHFVGHGSFDQQRDEGVLWLADAQGRAAPLMASQLARLLGDHRPLRLVVLNACEGAQGSDLDVFSSTAATLVRRGIPAVLAMQYEISDKAATLLAEWFYESLADGLPVDAAVAEARKAINLDNDRSLEWGTPVLFMRTGDGRIFDVQPAPLPQGPRLDPPVTPAGAGPTRAADKTPAPPTVEPTPRPALAGPAAGVVTPHFVKGADPLAINWCWVSGGPFKMGSEQVDSEKPIHEVSVDGFWLARYPVTNEQYGQFIKAGGYTEKRWWTDAGWDVRQQQAWAEPRVWQDTRWNGAQQPVVGVSWYEVTAFCTWATELTGEDIRLPTEAEWEKAARGTDGRTFPWGEAEPNDKLCHFNQDWSTGSTKPVGQRPLADSPYGCADMAGNVGDWTADWFKPYPGNNKTDTAYGETYSVVRGGSWYDDRAYVRCANRFYYPPDGWDLHVGFRCVRTAL